MKSKSKTKKKTKSQRAKELNKLSFKQVLEMFNNKKKGRYTAKVNK